MLIICYPVCGMAGDEEHIHWPASHGASIPAETQLDESIAAAVAH
ncbi:MAG: hypothetical protein OXF05_00510 [Hyphomicrobiales bacterium]|nr:hypothetical protein [Hyphomicrobiales bacterium]MCY4032720.1 hypothetical protein [Hyphomicrobiales bacterium]MCY4039354.1 hypothetical protein [Hyphomicrobiales bacterium]